MLNRENRAEIIQKVGRLVQDTSADFASTKILEAVEMAESDIRRAGPWPVLERPFPITVDLIATYTTGTVTATLDSTTITGSGTVFAAAMVGRKFRINGDSRFYRVAAVASGTSLTLDESYQNDDLDGTSRTYKIYQDEYPLPAELFAIYAVRSLKGVTPMRRQNMQNFFFKDPSADTVGDPYYYDFFTQPVERQPAGASTLVITSSSASGDNTRSVLVRGIVSGIPASETVVIVTNTVTTTNSYTRYTDIIKLVAWTGNLTATSNSANITITRIPPEYLRADFRIMWIYPLPKYNTRLYVMGWDVLPPLLTGNDVPVISSDVYVQRALAYILELSGEYAKAAIKFKASDIQIEKERMSQNADGDLYAEMLPATYELG